MAYAAEELDQLADTVIQTCVRPGSPWGWMAAAEAEAKSANWLPDPSRSALRYGLARSIEEQRSLSVVWREQAWFIGPRASDLDIWAAINSGRPYSSCTVSFVGATSTEMISILQSRLGFGEPAPMFGAGKGWLLSGNPSKPNQDATVLLITEQQLATGPGIVPPDGGVTLPGAVQARTFAGVMSFVYASGAQ